MSPRCPHHPSQNPPLRPLGPPPQMSASSSKTSRSGERSFRNHAVHMPVYPPPRMTTSAVVLGTGGGASGPANSGSARASSSHQERRAGRGASFTWVPSGSGSAPSSHARRGGERVERPRASPPEDRPPPRRPGFDVDEVRHRREGPVGRHERLGLRGERSGREDGVEAPKFRMVLEQAEPRPQVVLLDHEEGGEEGDV